MAKYGSTLAEVKVYINGKDQAKKELEELKAVAKSYSDQMALANGQMLKAAEEMAKARKKINDAAANNGKDSAEYKQAVDEELRAQQAHDEAQKRFKENQTEHKKYQRLIKETEKLNVDLEEAMGRLSEQDIKHLRMLQRQLDAIRNQIDPSKDKDGTFLAYVNNALKQVTETIKNRKGELIEFEDIMSKLTHVDDRSLDAVIKRLKDLIANTDKLDAEKLKKYKDQLSQAEGEKDRRVRVEALDVQQQVKSGTWKGTIEETQKAIELQKQYQKQLDATDTKGVKAVEETIDGLNKKLETYNKKQAASVMKNLEDSSYKEIQNAIEYTKKLQEAQKPGSSSWNRYGKQIADATLHLEKWNDQNKRTKMVELSKQDLGKMSDSDLKESLRYWDGMVNGIGRTNIAIKQYKEIYDRLLAENTKRADKLITTIEGGDLGGNISQMQQRLKILQDFRLTIDSTKPDAYLRVDAAIEKLKNGIKETTQGFLSFDDALAKAKTIAGGTFDGTLEDLDKIKKAIEEGMNTKLNLSDPKDIDQLKDAQSLLDDILKKQTEMNRLRIEEQAKQTIADVQSGSFDKTIEETQQAIKVIEEYKKTLRTKADAPAIQRANDAIVKLNEQLGKGRQELMDYKQALQVAKQVGDGTFDGTSEELERVKKSLEEYRKTLKQKTDAVEIKKVDDALKNVSRSAEIASKRIIDIDDVLKRLDSASMEELQLAAKQLQEELKDATRGTDEYTKTAAKLREVNKELKNVKKEWDGHDNAIVRVTKRLAAYVAVYGGFNEIVGKMKEIIALNLQLSDSMADVQKTTGLMGVELQELGRELERIDTRTATTELYQLAAAAGQIGLKTQEDALGFAKAANTISVALNELGAEGSATLTKIATLTGDVARSGTEQALLKVGSAINELTANSAATAGPIADFISRVGGIASASNIAIHEMAALGAATDASAQSIEIAGTSMNKFITALVSNTENIAYATNLNAKELQTLINEGNTMQAVIRVLESMQTMDRSGISGAMKELGSEGARMNQYIASMVSNLDLLKAQLAISKEAFEENVSVINEYNVKQESAMGILQRMKNAFMDMFVNSQMTVILKDVLETIASIPNWLEKNRALLLSIRILIAQIIAFKLPFLLNALMSQLSGMYKLLAGPVISAVASFGNVWKQARFQVYMAARQTGASVAAATAATKGFTGSLRTLWRVIAANPIGIIVSAIAAAAAIWYHFREETDKVAKATAELTKKHTRQIEELQALRNALEATNTSYAVKAAAMREINSLYSKYLGFELSELDNYEKKKAALDYINAKLKENQTLELATRQKEVYTESFNDETKKSIDNITEALMKIPEIGAKRLTEAMNVMNEAIQNGATTTEEIMDKLSEHFKADVEFDDDEWGFLPNLISVFTDTDLESLEKYIEKYSTLQEQLAGTDEYFNEQKIENQRLSDDALEKLAVAHQNRIQAIEAIHQEKLEKIQAEGSVITEAEQIEHLQTLLKEQEQYQKTAEKMLQRAKERDEKFLSEQTNNEGFIDLGNMHAKYGGTETGHIVSARVNELNSIRTEMAKIRKQLALDEQALAEETERLRKAQLKENNDDEIQAAKDAVEAKKKAINDGNEAIIRNEMEWNSQYAELQTWATSDARKKWGEAVDDINGKIRSLQIQIAGDPWGKAFDLKDWKQFPELIEGLEGASVTSLVQGFEKLRDNTKLITQDVDAFNKMFDLKTPLKDLEEVNTQVFRWLAQIRAELKRRDRNTSGAPIFTNAKQELDAVLNNLQAHFVKRQAEIRKAYIDGSMTSEEMDRRLAENDRTFINERIELRKLLLGENSNFIKELYPDLADTDLAKLRLDLQVLEDGITDDLRKALAEDENTVQEGAVKIRQAIEKELLATNPFGSLRENFRSSLDELQLMSSQFEREQAEILNSTFANLGKNIGDKFIGLDKENQQERLDFLIELSKKSYTVDRDGLREMFASHEQYYNWVANLDDQQMDVMLAKLQWFYDESLLNQKAYADRLIKAQESSYEQQGLKYNDVAKIQWQIENLRNQRNELVTQNLSEGLNPEQYKANEDAITAHTQAINRLEAKLLEEQEKANNKSKTFRSKKERETKEQMEASISALDAYYNEMEAFIRKRGLERNLTEEEIERQIVENSVARQKDMVQLRKKLLGDESSFDPNANGGYKGAITGTVFFGENKTEEMLQTQANQIKVWGKALMDGMRNQIAKSEIEIQKEAQKLRESIQKILLDKQYVQQAVNEMRESFGQIDFINEETKEKLNFLWGDTEQTARTENAAKERMKVLQSFSEDVYSEEAETFKKRLLQDATFGETVKSMDEEQYAAFLLLLQQYHDKVISAEKRHADERKRIIDQQWEDEGYQNGYDAAERTIGIAEENLNTMQNAGAIASEQEYFDQYQQLVLNRVALEQWAYEQRLELYKKNNATQEQFQQLDLEHAQKQQDFQQQLLDNYIARYQKMADITTSYGNIIGDGFGRMLAGEEDAGKQLIKNLLTETIQMASQFAQRLILQSTFGAQMESIRATQNAAQLSAAYATAMSEVGIEASKMAAIEAIAAGEITAQSMAQPDSIMTWGGAGAARAAVIIGLVAAATAAALALVNSLFPDSKASETKNRKLSTGMLTYAEGNYPVLGNDGKVYDAKYEGAGMKTGIYGGGAHFGIFSEKQPEMIVDGKTTQKLILNYPYIYDAITTIAKNGRLVNAMPTFASGDYPAGMNRIAQVEAVDISGGSNEDMIQMRATMEETREVNRQLLDILSSGRIVAHLDGLETHRQQKKNERFLNRRGIN